MGYLEERKNITRISIVGYSIGSLIARTIIELEGFTPYLNRLHTFLSISGPNLGTVFHNNLYSIGSWILMKITRSKAIEELEMKDSTDIENTFLYKLSCQKSRFIFLLLIKII